MHAHTLPINNARNFARCNPIQRPLQTHTERVCAGMPAQPPTHTGIDVSLVVDPVAKDYCCKIVYVTLLALPVPPSGLQTSVL